MTLETRECIALYVFLKEREAKLPGVLEKVMERCEQCAYDNLSVLELENMLAAGEGGAE